MRYGTHGLTNEFTDDYKLVLGDFINPLNDKKAEYFPRGAMVLMKEPLKKKTKNTQWRIHWLGLRKNLPQSFESLAKNKKTCWDYSGHLILPGFYDMHFHWVQDKVRLKGKASLLEWLKKYTFPEEEKFESFDYTQQRAKSFFPRLIQAGTVGGACYSSIHQHATTVAMENLPGNFIVGNVTMTIDSPKALLQNPKEAIQLVKKFFKKFPTRYAFTPRFALACDPQTMALGAKIARENNGFIQTHLSETPGEIAATLELYGHQFKTYTEIYNHVGLLTEKTIMGHGIYLSAQERKMLKKNKVAIAHCPTSNAPVEQRGLGSGLFDYQAIEKSGIAWALASDIGGGPFVSMLDVCRSFMAQNSHLKKSTNPATSLKALYRATLAGAKILGLDKDHGNFSKGKWADFVIIKDNASSHSLAQLRLEQLFFAASENRKIYDKMVKKVFIKGLAY